MAASFDQVSQNLCVRRGLKNAPLIFELLLQLGGVDKVSVMGKRQTAVALGTEEERLYIFVSAASSRRIPNVPDCAFSLYFAELAILKHFSDQPLAFVRRQFFTVSCYNASPLLSSVLEAVEP